jgi:thioredoxin reductase (NADPH)
VTLSGLGIPHRTLAADNGALPAVTLADGQVLTDPEADELTRALGFPTELDSHEADLVIIGAGPAGLSAAVYGASEGLRTTVLDGGAVGGQAGSSSLIRNYLGFPRGLGGGELAQRAYQQAWLFGAQFRLTHRATALEPRGARRVVLTDCGAEVSAEAVVLALGVEYRRLDAPGLTEREGAGVYYGASMSEAQALAGESVYVVGGGNSAGQAALHLARYACRVRILVRGDGLASTMSQYLIEAIERDPNIQVRTRTEVAAGLGEGRLEALELRSPNGTKTVPAAALIVLIGAHPHTEWLPEEVERDQWGYIPTGPDVSTWPLERPPFALETSLPGVFAAGDVRARAVKRVASAAGSGALSVSDVHAYLALEPASWPARS